MTGDIGKISRREAVIGLSLLGAAGIAQARQPQVYAQPLSREGLEKLLPKRIGSWTFETSSGLVLPPEDELSERLYDAVATRVYVSPDQAPVMFLAAYSSKQDGLLQLHRPELCYPAGGFQLSPIETEDLRLANGDSVTLRKFTATGLSRVEQVIYWTRLGDTLPRDWARQRLAVVEANLEGEIPDGVLVRMSCLGGDRASGFATLKRFADALSLQASAKTRAVLWRGRLG